MAKILCRKCGTVSDDSLGGCPNCGEPFLMAGAQPRCIRPAPAVQPVKKKKSKLLNFVQDEGLLISAKEGNEKYYKINLNQLDERLIGV